MGLLNLALAQLLGIFLPMAGLLVALYFYDRSRRRVVVSTLRFWPKRPAPAVRQRHKRIQHPLSLVLQLIALGLLLLAIADPRPGASPGSSQRRVIVLDTSAAMALADGSGTSLMEQAKALALAYVSAVPAGDRLMLIEADGSPMVRVPFTLDRQRVRDGIAAAEPSLTPLDMRAAFDLADGTLRLALGSGGEPLTDHPNAGETVYVGPGRFAGQPARSGALPRVRYLQTEAPSDSLGILSLEASANLAETGRWDVALEARNYGSASASTRVEFLFDDRPLGHRDLALPAEGEASLHFTLRSRSRGRLRAQLASSDAYEPNNVAEIAIPAPRPTRVQVHGASEREFGALLAAGAGIEADYVSSRADLSPDSIHVWASGGEAVPSRRSIYVAPPGTPSPIPEAASVRRQPVVEWSASHPLAEGIRDRDLIPQRARVFAPLAGDDIIASTSDGPVVVARSGSEGKLVTLGFDLMDPSVRDRLSAPMLFANAVAWLDSSAFRAESVGARSPGPVSIEAPNSAAAQISVRTAGGAAVPWVLSNGEVRFYADRRDVYLVATADRDLTLALEQPQVPIAAWDPPESVLRGVPSRLAGITEPGAIWPWLAALGALILLYDWIRFGRGRRVTAEGAQGIAQDATEGRP